MRLSVLVLTLGLLFGGLSGCSSTEADFVEKHNEAVALYSTGDLAQALDLMVEALEIKPDSAEARQFVENVSEELRDSRVFESGISAQRDGDWEYAISRFQLIDEESLMAAQAQEEIIRSYNLWASQTIKEVQNSATSREPYENAEILEELAKWGLEKMEQLEGYSNWGAYGSYLTGKEKLTDAAIEYRRSQLLAYEEDEKYVQAVGLLNELIDMKIYALYNLEQVRRDYSPFLVEQAVNAANDLINDDRLEDADRPIKAALLVYPESEGLKDALGQVEGFLEDRYQRALENMKTVTDDFDNITFYYDRQTYSSYAGNKFFLYIGKKGNSRPYLRFQMMYYGSDWVFWERLRINVDGKIYEINPGYLEVERDNYTSVWEWYDTSPSEDQLDMLRDIAKSEKTVLRYEGDYRADRTLTSAQKQAIRNVLDAFEALK